MENITAEIIEPYESKNYQVFQRPQYTEQHHSVPDLSLQKQTETQVEVAHKSRTGSRPDDTTQVKKKINSHMIINYYDFLNVL